MTMQSQTHPTMEHILQVVFALPADSPLQKMLSYNGYHKPADFIVETYATLETLEYPDDTGALATISTEAISLLKLLKQYVAYQNSQKVPFDKDYWTNITQAQFNAFRVSNGTISCHCNSTFCCCAPSSFSTSYCPIPSNFGPSCRTHSCPCCVPKVSKCLCLKSLGSPRPFG